MNNTYQYFISKNHIIPQCKKLLSIIKQPTTEEYMSLCYQELKKKDIELFNLYYHRKPNNISEKDFITKLSHKAVLDTAQIIYNKIKLLNNPYNPTPNIQQQNNFNSLLPSNFFEAKKEQSSLLPPRVGQLQPPTNNIQPQSYSEIYNQYTGGVKPNEVEVMNKLKHMGPQEDYVKKGYLNNNNTNNRQLQQLQQQINQPQQYQQPNQQYNQYQQQYQQPQQCNQPQQYQQQFNQYQQPQQQNQQQQQLPPQLQPINTLQLNQQNPVKVGEYKYNPIVPIPQNMQMVGLLANDPNLQNMIQGQGTHAQISNEIAGKTNFIPGLDDYNQNKALMDQASQDPKSSANDLSHLENF